RHSLSLEEVPQQLAGTVLSDPADYLRPVIEPRMPHQITYAPAHSGLRIVRAEHQPPHFREHYGSGALRARLECHVQGAVGETVGREDAERILDGEQLGVGGGVATGHRWVVSRRDGRTVPNPARTGRAPPGARR